MDDLVFVFDKITVGTYAVLHSRLDKQLFVLCQPLPAGIFLQDDEVAADFRSGMVGKEVVDVYKRQLLLFFSVWQS